MSETDLLQDRLEQMRGDVELALCGALDFGDVKVAISERLIDAMRYSLLGSGKRLRPLFVLFGNILCGGNYTDAIPAACSVEMVHAYSLVHDDLPAMDDDDLRRGRLTCHKRFDEATAILVGDALLALAFEELGKLPSLEIVGICCKELANAAGATGLVGGQMDDVANEKNLNVKTEKASIDLLEQIHLRKTGALIRVALRLGAIIAKATKEQINALDEYGKNFGLAFQITDDLLDELGNEKTVGKRLHKDKEMNKWTYPALLGIKKSQDEAKKYVNNAINALNIFDNNITEKKILIKITKDLIGREK
ncbi:MAG: polyprenyl synthetase family protein [Planctomycetaceae bacterium]|jgi:geranylgeranyl diphosphate synthase type II|nr:polyprenyl synthetase family protein [Planctomycetaceae bacterium]